MSSPNSPRVTLAQLMTVPIFAAVALACIAPALKSGAVRYYGLVPFLLGEAILVPLVLATTGQLILRRGRVRERLVAAFLAVSASSAFLTLLALVAVSLWDSYMAITLGMGVPLGLIAFVIALTGGLIALKAVIAGLWSRAVPGRCPGCGRRALHRDPAEDESGGRSAALSFVCDSCGLRFRIERRGTTTLDDDAPSDADAGCPASTIDCTW